MKASQKRVLLIGGSLNQTSIVHAVGRELGPAYDCYYSPCFGDGLVKILREARFIDSTILGFGRFYADTMEYFRRNHLKVDPDGKAGNYDLIITATDLVLPKLATEVPTVLVQEGMTDPETPWYKFVASFGLPLWITGNTAGTGQSKIYKKFCVGSEGYKDFFSKRGVPSDRMIVTGIPNYDNAKIYVNNEFPHRDFVLVATSDMRETLKSEDRQATIENALRIANGRQLIFKLHPNEKKERAISEIKKHAPNALVFSHGNVHEMIANCAVLITQYSTVVYTGIALDKEVYSLFDINELKRLAPIQNQGTSGQRIAEICREVLSS